MTNSNLQIALDAAMLVEPVFKKGFESALTVSLKKGKGVVTEVDKQSEALIIEFIQKKSDYPILAEESGITGSKESSYWVIDPLDGTTNFTRKIPLCATSIALIVNHQIMVGVVFNPLLNERYHASKGEGAFYNGQKITTSTISELNNSMIYVNNGYAAEDKKRYAETVNVLGADSSLRKYGSSALELCYVAKGSAEAFLSSGDELWDYAAGLLIVEEAGGKVTDWKGDGWDNSNSFILASNGLVHSKIVEMVKNLQK